MRSGASGDLRWMILDAALTLGEQRGWDAVHLHELAQVAGVTLSELQRHFEHKDAVARQYGRETVRVPVQQIEWVDAAGDYLCIHANGNTHILRATMREMENLLDPRLFQRVHRSTIVNLTRVKSLRAHMNGEYFLRLEGGQELKLSRTYRDKVEYFLKRPRAH